jgi:hypothetical protein
MPYELVQCQRRSVDAWGHGLVCTVGVNGLCLSTLVTSISTAPQLDSNEHGYTHFRGSCYKLT